jgi:hypothetical protein
MQNKKIAHVGFYEGQGNVPDERRVYSQLQNGEILDSWILPLIDYGGFARGTLGKLTRIISDVEWIHLHPGVKDSDETSIPLTDRSVLKHIAREMYEASDCEIGIRVNTKSLSLVYRCN